MSATGQWWTQSWNPVTGCVPMSAGCDNCYAQAMAGRFKQIHGAPWTTLVEHPERWGWPAKWRKPRRIFVNSMSDWMLWTRSQQNAVFDAAYNGEHHTWLTCTKRAGLLSLPPRMSMLPSQHLWHGVTVEHQDYMKRLALCRDVLHLWLSAEPRRGPLTLPADVPLAWGVVGGETGPAARECRGGWIESLVIQCEERKIPVWVKSLGDNCNVIHVSREPRELPEAWKLEGER